MWILGYDLHLIWAILIFFTVFMVVYSGIITLLEPYLPTFILELFRYGKTLNGPVQSSFVGLISVPKSYFTHFYIFSSVYIPLLLGVACVQYTQGGPPAPRGARGHDRVCTEPRTAPTPPAAVLLVLSLLSLQCFRRLYECVYVNQPSKSTMNITHYIVGFAHYFCAGTGVLCEAAEFSPSGPAPAAGLSPLAALPLTLAFLWAWHQQLAAHRTFAQLKVAHPTKHSVPHGGLFALVSCPHYTMEMVLYTVLMLVLGPGHSTCLLVWAWVIVNQAIAGLMSHRWYRATFRDYPAGRRAVIPYLL
jgi:3-oxo-5-alpha-steroid 4-dehydrogenase 3